MLTNDTVSFEQPGPELFILNNTPVCLVHGSSRSNRHNRMTDAENDKLPNLFGIYEGVFSSIE